MCLRVHVDNGESSSHSSIGGINIKKIKKEQRGTCLAQLADYMDLILEVGHSSTTLDVELTLKIKEGTTS